MTFAQNMTGLCLTACLTAIVLLRVGRSSIGIWRSAIAAAVVSGTIWLVAWALVQGVTWAPKLIPIRDYTATDWMISIVGHILALVIWSGVAIIPALATALVYKRAIN